MKRIRSSLPRFNLELMSNQDHGHLYLIYRYGSDANGKRLRLKYSIREVVQSKYWLSGPTYRLKESLLYPDAHKVNQKLSSIYNKAIELSKNHDIGIKEFKDELDYHLNYKQRPTSKRDTLFIEFVDSYIEKSTNHSRTISKYKGIRKHLFNYSNSKAVQLSFDDITMDFASDFAQWMYSNHSSSQNTVSKALSIIKQFMSDADVNGYHDNRIYVNIGVKRIKTSKVYLELSELEQIAEFDLSDNNRLERVKDLFLIACYTGLRYSDFTRLKADHIIEVEGLKMIDLYQYKGRETKSDNQVIIPVLPQLAKILEKYDYNLPTPYSATEMNRTIKKVLQAAGVNRLLQYKESKAGKTVTESIEVWQKTTNHTARFSFINMMINDYGISPMDLSKITGQSLKVLLAYERGDKRKNAVKVYSQVIEQIAKGKLRAV